MKDILSEIIANKRFEVDLQKQTISLEQLQEGIGDIPMARSMKQALSSSSSGIIAECKRRAPSKGWIKQEACPEEIIPSYVAAGASALYQARIVGAVAVLLIAAALGKDKCQQLTEQAHVLGLEVLLEIHSTEELSYINKEIDMVGINNRNLGTFITDIENSFRLAGQLPQDTVLVSESGISNPEVVKLLRANGFHGFLIGETFMKTPQPGETLQSFIQSIH